MSTNKTMKKGRNPSAIDNWLDALGLYRKNIAYDETCLFRAISEQLFDCQIHHERVRKEVVEYGRNHYFEFWDLLDSEEQWYEHLALLEKHMIVCGNLEIQMISFKYNRDVIIFDGAHQQIYDATKRNLGQNLMLCLMNEDHYDVIHMKDHIINAGFCQSIVYGILYENVFGISNVSEIVNGMLYDKTYVPIPSEMVAEHKKLLEINNNNLNEQTNNNEQTETTNPLNQIKIALFPFKIAKALDPTIYRNIEYDSWTEIRREMRLGDWYYGDDKLILGTRCIYNDVINNEKLQCYIQEIISQENRCVVYITKLAEKRLVNYTDLSPENDAKPWPLPYRFTKTVPFTPTNPPTIGQKFLKTVKKRKDKKNTKNTPTNQTENDSPESSVNLYVGVPLQMQNENQETQPTTTTPEQPITTKSEPTQEPPTQIPANKMQWPNQWNTYMPTESIVWTHAPPTPQAIYNFNVKPMMPSTPITPITPGGIPYHETNYQYYCNYPMDNYNWSNDSNGQNDNSTPMDTEDKQESNENIQYNPNQSVEMYSPVLPMPSGTPVIYTPVHDMGGEVLMQPSMPMYTPPVDPMQYMSPGSFIYPPTPPSAWYPPGINSQGFIFPAPMN